MDEYYNQVVAICKERNMYQPLSTGLKKMEKQHQDADVVRFLLGLKPEYEFVRAQILGASDLPSLPKVFSRVQCATLFDHSPQLSSEHNGECAASIAARGNFGSSHGGRGGCFFVVDVILEDVVGLEDVGLTSTLIVAILIILWIIVGIFMAHHLHLPTRFLFVRILQLHMDHWLAQAHL
jgi:hypothetical protein